MFVLTFPTFHLTKANYCTFAAMQVSIILNQRYTLDGYEPSQAIALTFAQAKFNDLVSRGGTFSTPIKLAKTANNRQIFGEPDDNKGRSARPYTRFDCTLKVGGNPVFEGVAVLEESQDSYELRIFSALADFFKLVGDKSIRDLDLSAHNHAWTAVNVFAATNSASNYCYPAINYGRWTGTKAARPHTDFFPATFFKLLLETAATEEGWTLNSYSSNWGIPFSLQDFENEKGVLFTSEYGSDKTENYASLLGTGGFFVSGLDTVTNDPTSHAHTDIYSSEVYETRPDGAYDFEVNLTYTTAAGGTKQAALVQTDYSTVKVLDRVDIPNGTDLSVSLRAYGVSHDASLPYVTVLFTSTLTTGSVTIKAGSSLSCTNGREAIKTGDLFNLADTLPDIKIKDLYLFEAVRQNAIIDANPINKTLEFVPFDTIAGRWGIAFDWSAKANLIEKAKYEFRLEDFAQINYLEWKEGTDEDPAYRANNDLGNSSIAIEDGGLDLEKVMYTAPFAATVKANSFTDNFHARVLRYSGSGIAYDAPDINPVARAMPLISSASNLVQITSGGGTVTAQIMGEPETWSDILAANYTSFEEMLTRLKLVSVELNLNAEDIAKLDFTRPVYLLGNYWFVREIRQWVANKTQSTTVKLLRL